MIPHKLLLFSVGYDVECDFEHVKTSNKIVTKFHHIDHGRIISEDIKSTFNYSIEQYKYSGYYSYDEKNRYFLKHEHMYSVDGALKQIRNGTCYQTVDQLCQPWVQRLNESDKLQEARQTLSSPIHNCHCRRYQHTFTPNLSGMTNR